MNRLFVNRKTIFFLAVILILAVSIPILTQSLKDKLIFQPKKIQPKLVRETTITQAASESHPELYLADIEYNPQTGVIIQRETSVGRGDPPPFFAEKPPKDPNRISYKVEVVTKENIILQSGWYSDYKQKVQTKENTLRFSVVAGYEPGATIKLYYPSEEKLIWIGRIQ